MRTLSGSLFVLGILFATLFHAPADAQGGSTYQCNDGIDNNGNGQVDMADPYCTSPWYDNDESSFKISIPGMVPNQPRSLDCWFDGDTGNGNDGCQIHACCDITGPCPADLQPQYFNPTQCQVSTTCRDTCAPLTKPGCDCFGCCQICAPGTSCIDVFINDAISPDCTLENLSDPAKCRRCVRHPDCNKSEDVIFEYSFERPLLLESELAPLIAILKRASR